jgi:hypothetical protein
MRANMRFGIKAAATLIVFISMAFSACNLPGTGSDSDPQDQQQDVSTDYFTDQGFGNPLGYIQLPCAEYYKGVTYVAFQGSHEDAYVCSYNHDMRQWTGPIRAGVSMMGKTPDPVDNDQVDNHGRPALVVDNEGYIHLCFGGHGGYEWLGENQFGRPGKGKQTHVVSKRPEDISEWKELEGVSPFGTYNQFIKMDNGDIYLFYRHGSHKSDWVYQKSADNGRTFEKEVPVLKSKLLADSNTHDAWYAQFSKGPDHTIMCMCVYHACAEVDHSTLRENVYYMRMDCADGSWKNAAGELLNIPLTKEDADIKTLVFDSKGQQTNHGICRFDLLGNPHIIFRFNRNRFWYTQWINDHWQDPVQVTNSDLTGQFADMIIQSPGDINMVISGSRLDGGGEVCWWYTNTTGLSWEKAGSVITSSTVDYRIGVLTRNYHPDGKIFFFERDPNTPHLYRKIFLWGENGFVKRNR